MDPTVPPNTPAAPAAAQVAAPAAPAQSTTPPAAPPPADAPKFVPVSPEEWQAVVKMREDLAKIQADQRKRDAKAREDQIKAMTQKGEIENAFKALRDDSERSSRPSACGSRR